MPSNQLPKEAPARARGALSSWKELPRFSFVEKMADGIAIVYQRLSAALLVDWLTARVANKCGCSRLDCPDCEAWSIRKAQVTEILVLIRLLVASSLLWLFSPVHIIVVMVSSILIYDVSIAHLEHLIDPSVGSAGPGMRLSARRSLIIAVVNVLLYVLLFASLFRVYEKTSPLESIQLSWSSMTTLGVMLPTTGAGRVLALVEVAFGLFMFGFIISTVLAAFEERRERSSKQ